MVDSATFLASFPPIQSAIKVDGAGGGMRVQLDIPETEMADAVHLLAWRQQVLRITVEVIETTGALPTKGKVARDFTVFDDIKKGTDGATMGE